MKYEIEENNHDWLNKGLWYNTTICSKFHGTVSEDFIRNDITDGYNLIYYINSHDIQQPTYVDDTSSSCGRAIHNNATTE